MEVQCKVQVVVVVFTYQKPPFSSAALIFLDLFLQTALQADRENISIFVCFNILGKNSRSYPSPYTRIFVYPQPLTIPRFADMMDGTENTIQKYSPFQHVIPTQVVHTDMRTGFYVFPCLSKAELMYEYKVNIKSLCCFWTRIIRPFEKCTWFSCKLISPIC